MFKKTHSYVSLFILGSLLGLLLSCGSFEESSFSSSSEQGAIIDSSTDVYPTSFITGLIAEFDANAGGALTTAGISAKYAVNQYNLTYNTKDANGNPTVASAKLLIPSFNKELNLVVFFNIASKTQDSLAGTNSYVDLTNFDGVNPATIAHNMSTDDIDSLLCTILASTGTAVLMPDYLGFGTSSGLHPYINANGYSYSSIDAIRAAKNYANSSAVSFTFNEKFILTGYSGGGYATMATHKELVENASKYTDLDINTNLKGVIPGAPPCNLSTIMASQLINVPNFTRPDYGPYILLSYNEVYNLVPDVKNLFKEEYKDVVDDFYSGTKSLSEDIVIQFQTIIDDENLVPLDIFSDSFKNDVISAYSDFNSPESPGLDTPSSIGFFEKIIENDVHNYNPGSTNIFFIHLNADPIVPITNSKLAVQTMLAKGTAQLFNSSTGAGNVAILDPVLYADQNTRNQPYTNGTFNNHSLGLPYYFIIMQTLSNMWFSQ